MNIMMNSKNLEKIANDLSHPLTLPILSINLNLKQDHKHHPKFFSINIIISSYIDMITKNKKRIVR
jgi:hypothetical protein